MPVVMLSFLAGLLIASSATASVVLTGTRIIYPQALTGKTLQLSNADDHPWLVQLWLDQGREDSRPDEMDSAIPFALSPPIFRIEPHSGQAVRLMLDDANALPTDRESLFYLNFTQLPALEEATLEANRLLMLMRNRVKLFYRPRALPSSPDLRELACRLQFHLTDTTLTINNPAAFHVVVSRAELLLDQTHQIRLLHAETLPPFSQHITSVDDILPEPPPAGARVRIALVNDYGAEESHDCRWH